MRKTCRIIENYANLTTKFVWQFLKQASFLVKLWSIGEGMSNSLNEASSYKMLFSNTVWILRYNNVSELIRKISFTGEKSWN